MIVEPISFLRLPLAAAVEHKWNALGAIRDPGADCSTLSAVRENGNDAKSGWCRIGSNDQNCTILVICVS